MVEARDDGENTTALTTGGPALPLGAVIELLDTRGRRITHHLEVGTCRVGAAPDNDLVVVDPAVSRHHLSLELAPEGVLVRDLDSLNGTRYRGQRIGSLTLSPGSRIQIGESTLLIEADAKAFEQTSGDGPEQYGDLRGKAKVMRRLYALMQRLEGSLVNVLVTGPSGAGKELVARALHRHSKIADRPFLTINCGTLERSLVASELFGHAKGAFTGASSARSGAFEEADGGCLFLDEIGELPLDVQPVLLRVLELGTYCRLGESRERSVQVRVLAATHKNLEEEIEAGRFRADLFYRLAVVQLEVPSLESHAEDIPLLARHVAAELGIAPLPDELCDELCRRSWPGNVRQLKNALLSYSVLDALPPEKERAPDQRDETLEGALRGLLSVDRPYSDQKNEIVRLMTRVYLQMLMQHTGGNRSEAARLSGLQRAYLRRLLQAMGLAGDATTPDPPQNEPDRES